MVKIFYVSLIFIVGILVGNNMPTIRPTPWYDDGNFYRGDLVKHTPELDHKYYSFCKQGQVMYVYDQNHILVEWTQCEELPFENARGGFLDLHSKTGLIKK